VVNRPFIIGIAGPSGSGKTTVSRSLLTRLKTHKTAILPLDTYYHDLAYLPFEERNRTCFDTPEALDLALLTEHVRKLRGEQPIDMPVYDFATHCRAASSQRFLPTDVLIVEGLMALYWQPLREYLDLKVYVNAKDETCLTRRITRDVRGRGRTEMSVRQQYESTVSPMAEIYVLPTCQFADIVVDGESSVSDVVEKILAQTPLS
jgi:uridine kinase